MGEYLTPALERWRARTEWPLLIVAVGTLPVLLVELARDELPSGDRVFLDAVNVFVLVVFAVDYIVGLRLARNRRAFARAEWSSLLIVFAQAVALLPGLATFGALRALRVLRAGRLWRLLIVMARAVAVGRTAATDGRRMIRQHAASIAFGLAGFTWLTSAASFTLVEDVGADGRLQSFFDALWWSSATITTVGYGDVYPVTTAGRLIGVFTMVVGIGTFAVVTAKIAEFLVRSPDDGS